MFSLSFVITQLYPYKELEEQQKLIDRCLELEPFYWESWEGDKNKPLMKEEEFQLRLVRTLFELQMRDEGGIALSIMDSLEKWSENENMVYPDFAVEENHFYSMYYAFIGFLMFSFLGPTRKLYLLRSRFIVTAALYEVPIYVDVQNYFRQYGSVRVMSEEAAYLELALRSNNTPIGTEGRTMNTVSEWIEIFDKYLGSSFDNKVNEFMETKMEVMRMDGDIQQILYKILTLFYGLKSGTIWREIEGDVPPGYIPDENPIKKTRDEWYLELLSQGETEQYTDWLKDWRGTITWLLLSDKDRDYINTMFYTITKKVDLNNEDQAKYLFEFINGLYEAGWEMGNDLLYYDESQGKFVWNEEMVKMLEEEMEYIEWKKESGYKEEEEEKKEKAAAVEEV